MTAPLTRSELASALGKLGKGVKKNITPEERERRRERMKVARAALAQKQAARKEALQDHEDQAKQYTAV